MAAIFLIFRVKNVFENDKRKNDKYGEMHILKVFLYMYIKKQHMFQVNQNHLTNFQLSFLIAGYFLEKSLEELFLKQYY